MSAHWVALVLATFWIAAIGVTAWRLRDSRSLEEYPAAIPDDAPLVSVVIPARNEERNIERCLRSVLASTWPALDIIVVDDHSTDGTGAIARRIAHEAASAVSAGVAVSATRPATPIHRTVRVIPATELPSGWFGKQWACHSGAQVAKGPILLFTDADTDHGPELLARAIAAMRERGSWLFTVAGRQELGSFWEKVVQPVVFAVLHARYGGLEQMSRTAKPLNKIANGQFLLFPREAYERVGGHAAVLDHVAEDLMLAQRVTAMGGGMHMVLAQAHLSTRMYTSLAELRRGWGKNVFAAGQDTIRLGPVTRRLFPFALPLAVLAPALPAIAALLWWPGILGDGAVVFAAITAPVNLAFWIGMYRFAGLNPLWAFLHPLGALVFSGICAEAAYRGTHVSWKGRDYLMVEGSGAVESPGHGSQ